MSGESLGTTVRYWEFRRIWYNAALTALVAAWVAFTWPHSRGMLTPVHAVQLFVLAAMANLFYSTVYLIDIPLQQFPMGDTWRRRRWVLWLAGTLLALLIAYYWIADEIYPYL